MEITFDTNNLNESDLRMLSALTGSEIPESTNDNDRNRQLREALDESTKIISELEDEIESYKNTLSDIGDESLSIMRKMYSESNVKGLSNENVSRETNESESKEEIKNEQTNEEASSSATIATKMMYFKNTETGEIFKVAKGTDVAEYAKKPFEISTRKDFKAYEEEQEAAPKEEETKIPDSELTIDTTEDADGAEPDDYLTELLGNENTPVNVNNLSDLAKLIQQFVADFDLVLATDLKKMDKDALDTLLEKVKEEKIDMKFPLYELLNTEILIEPKDLKF